MFVHGSDIESNCKYDIGICLEELEPLPWKIIIEKSIKARSTPLK